MRAPSFPTPFCIVLLAGVLVLGRCPPTRADDASDADVAAQLDARRQHETAVARQLLGELRLKRLQAQRLLPIAEKAAELHLRAFEANGRLLPDLVSAYRAFAAEDRLNQGFSPAVEHSTARLHRQDVSARDRLNEQLIDLEAQALKHLTNDQRAVVRDFRPGQRDHARRLNRAAPRGGVRPVRLDRPSDGQRLAELNQQMDEVQRARHPQPGALGRHLLHPAAFEALCGIAVARPTGAMGRAIEVYRDGTTDTPLEELAGLRAELAGLAREINNWNLINGLHLTRPQIERILSLCDGAAAGGGGPGTARPAKATGAAVVALEAAVSEVLNSGQRQVLADYKPCLIPPKNLKDPVRIGQASDHTGAAQWLSTARRLEGAALRAAIEFFLEREQKHNGPLSTGERQKRVSTLRSTVRRAAALSDTEFELCREELAAGIMPPDRAALLREEIEGIQESRGQPGRLARFMLNEPFMTQLRDRARLLAGGSPGEAADLAAGPQAENCEDSCAVKPRAAKPRRPRGG